MRHFWRVGNFHPSQTKVPPIDAEFKDKSSGGTYNIWKSFFREEIVEILQNLHCDIFCLTPVCSQ